MRFLKTSIAAALVGFGTVAASPAWAISNSIESIIGSQQGEATQVRIRMGMPLTEVPPSFSLATRTGWRSTSRTPTTASVAAWSRLPAVT